MNMLCTGKLTVPEIVDDGTAGIECCDFLQEIKPGMIKAQDTVRVVGKINVYQGRRNLVTREIRAETTPLNIECLFLWYSCRTMQVCKRRAFALHQSPSPTQERL